MCTRGGSSAGAATSMPTELPLDALEMALWARAQASSGVADQAARIQT
jgi:hypothetical protein